jgi:hypothetical protein
LQACNFVGYFELVMHKVEKEPTFSRCFLLYISISLQQLIHILPFLTVLVILNLEATPLR